MNPARIESRLRELLEAGALAKSTSSQELVSFVAPLLDSGVLAWERSGAGEKLCVRNAETLSSFILDRFPFTELEMEAEISRRVASVGRFRNTKTLRSDTPDIVTVRGWSDMALWHKGKPVVVSEATRKHAIFSFALTPDSRYELRTSCALVENPAVLLGFERFTIQSEIPLAIFAGGRVSHRLLDWLASQTASSLHVHHFPDYDPVGLSEYARLQGRLGDRTSLHLPVNLADYFARFGNKELLRFPATRRLLAKLRSVPIPEVCAVIDLIDRHNAVLEQEALLLRLDDCQGASRPGVA
ncbi:MAG: hypothetical protein H0X40_11285 [Chthoniobacterales bacterium]|nr:hypothetical protein [Chthoniobacterales bacterium]